MADHCIEDECIFFRRSEYKDWKGSCRALQQPVLIPKSGEVECGLAKTKQQHLADAKQFML